MKCKVNASHLQINKYDEQGNMLKEEVIYRRDEIIDLPPERIERLGSSVTPLEQDTVKAGTLPPETIVKPVVKAEPAKEAPKTEEKTEEKTFKGGKRY